MEARKKIEIELIAVAVTVVLAIIGFAFWLGGLHGNVAEIASKLTTLNNKVSSLEPSQFKESFVGKQEYKEAQTSLLSAITSRSLSFSQLNTGVLEKVTHAASPGLVLVNVTYGNQSPIRGVICGYADDQVVPKARRASVAIDFGDKAYIPYAYFVMPVAKGEYWQVSNCSGNDPSHNTNLHVSIL